MVTASQVNERLQEAQTDDDFAQVKSWLVDNGFPPDIASEHIAIYRLQRAGQRLPDTPSQPAA